MDDLDDAATAALWALMSKPREEIGLLYQGAGGVARTPTHSTGGTRKVGGTFKIPPGSLLGLFHNHPAREIARGAYGSEDAEREQFSGDDIRQARALGVPSYISASDRVMRYDPSTKQTSEVLAQFPMDEFRAYLMRTLLDRAPDDPRGLKR